MRQAIQSIPVFHEDLPDCSSAGPTGMQTSWCPRECDVQCRNQCEGAWNQARCTAKCEKECMEECLFVPCCTRESICDNGIRHERERCRFSSGEGMRISHWVTTGPC